MNEKPTLETERLILRAFAAEDAPALFAYAKSEMVGPNAGWKPHANVEESKGVIDFFNGKDFMVWAIVLKETGVLIGSVGILKSTKGDLRYDVELGYALGYDYWGKGIMTEAAKRVVEYSFEVVGVNSIICSHFPNNLRSARVAEKCGFDFLCSIKGSWKNFDGQLLDEDVLILYKDRYLELKQTGLYGG